jgi:GntR family transcriptional regulator, transcriptional repressor for pyruvate dehydrogenase complex
LATPLTDQAIAKIKELIISGDFTPGSKLPREQDLAKQLGLSRSSLREAVRALTLVGVLDARVGDGTYVTSLDSDLLLTGMSFVGDLLAGPTLLEVHQVRRILEPVATGLAATRLTEEEFEALERCLDLMDDADTTPAFIEADAEFHRVIVQAAGNATLASLIQNLSSGMMRARMWRTIAEEGAVEATKQRHRDIYLALRAGDAERASAADRLHLAEGEEWLRRVLNAGDTPAPVRGTAPGNGKGQSP